MIGVILLDAGVAVVAAEVRNLAQRSAMAANVTEIVAAIAAASAEQTTGIDQVNRAVTQMDQVTQSNAA
jgi:methyl-accepting chemotaxis protein